MLTTEHLAMGGREGEHKSFVYILRFEKQISPTPIMAGKVNTNLLIHFETQKQISPTPGNFGLELDADLSAGRSSGDIDTFLCIQMTKVGSYFL